MSTLSATNLKNASSTSNNIVLNSDGTTTVGGNTTVSGNLLFNSGYGSVATAYGCRAWVNFNGTSTVAIRASGNVSSITDNGTGDYTVNFTTAMPDANYGFSTCAGNGDGVNYVALGPTAAPTTTALRFETGTTGASTDLTYIAVAIFR